MLQVDPSSVLSFRERLRDVPRQAQPGLRTSIIGAASVIASAARVNASWSSRIPGAIKTQVRFGTRSAVEIVVDSRAAPHARPFEGITQRGSTFRHPVFGRGTWVEQQTRPFLMPAVQQHEDAAVRGVQSAIDAVFSRLP